MTNLTVQERLKGSLIVSCQAWPGDPLDDTDAIRRMAMAALRGGAAGLRINSPQDIVAIRRESSVPIIGLQKRIIDGVHRITPSFDDAAALAQAGASIIALDCSDRNWSQGDPWPAMIVRIHEELGLPVMADVATLEEAHAAAEAGADFVGPTMHGYTSSTRGSDSFNWTLLSEMARTVGRPIIAEGHISTPVDARRAISNGAWSVVVGSAITRPGDITRNFMRVLYPAEGRTPALGVDLGGTSIKAGLVDASGRVDSTVQVQTRAAEGRAAVLQSLEEAIRVVLSAGRAQGIEPCGLGIASAGVIDTETGVVFAATSNLPDWEGFNLRQVGEDTFHLRTYAINDAQGAALAEQEFGRGRSLTDFIALTLGTGVGGGVVCNGQLLQGKYGVAGSIGHQTIRYDGRPCNCGRRGCLEAYVSTRALLETWSDIQGGDGIPDGDPAAHAYRIAQQALAGDAVAREAYSRMGEPLAEAVANLFNIFDPQAVLLSGGLVEKQEWFVKQVETRVRALLHFGEKRNPVVSLAGGGHLAGVQGAGALVFQRLT